MDISSLLPSSDNLYKFLFMGGVFMVVFAFLYPIDKKQKIQLEIVSLNSKIAVERYKIKKIKFSIDSINREVKPTLERLNKAKGENNSILINGVKRQFNISLDIISRIKNEAELKQIEISSENNKILLLENHIKEFEKFQLILLILGPIFTIYGLVKWRKSILTTELIQDIQLKKLAQDNNITINKFSLKDRVIIFFKL